MSMRICVFHEPKFMIIFALVENKALVKSQLERQNASKASPKIVMSLEAVCVHVCVDTHTCTCKHICTFLLLLWECCERDRVKGREKMEGTAWAWHVIILSDTPFCRKQHGSLDLETETVLAFTGYLKF